MDKRRGGRDVNEERKRLDNGSGFTVALKNKRGKKGKINHERKEGD